MDSSPSLNFRAPHGIKLFLLSRPWYLEPVDHWGSSISIQTGDTSLYTAGGSCATTNPICLLLLTEYCTMESLKGWVLDPLYLIRRKDSEAVSSN